ncbi:MAG: rod shape-determining protein MreD [bacterium]|nr:rod shape-determining protein MreD [bacterium]
MNRKLKIGLFLVLIALQILFHRYMNVLRFNLDLLYLILVFISVKSGFLKSILSGTVIGLVTDFFSMQVMGVFGFSRTLMAYLLNETSRHIDLKNNTFVFLLISVSLFLSNLLANVFFHFIKNADLDLNMILYQPLLTGLLGVLIISPTKVKRYLDVY